MFSPLSPGPTQAVVRTCDMGSRVAVDRCRSCLEKGPDPRLDSQLLIRCSRLQCKYLLRLVLHSRRSFLIRTCLQDHFAAADPKPRTQIPCRKRPQRVMAHSGLHLFSLPLELLDTLTPRVLSSSVRGAPQKTKVETVKNETYETTLLDPAASRSCNVCPGAVFANTDIEGHRSHFRTDWHRYNVKSKLSNGRLVNERDFAILVEGMRHVSQYSQRL